MKRDDNLKCECGGETEYYSGALGYEAMVCRQCGYHWNGQTEVNHLRQVEEYRRIKQAVTREMISSLDNLYFEAKGYLRDLARHSVDATTLIGALKQAKSIIDQSKGDSSRDAMPSQATETGSDRTSTKADEFGRGVLKILTDTEEWSSDTTDEISSLAFDLGLATLNEYGEFQGKADANQ